MEECAFFLVVCLRCCFVVLSFFSLYHLPSLRLLWSSTLYGVRTESAFLLFPPDLLALLWCLRSFLLSPVLFPKWKMGTDERRQMTMSRLFSSSRRPALPTVAFSTSRDGLFFCTPDPALWLDVFNRIPLLYSLFSTIGLLSLYLLPRFSTSLSSHPFLSSFHPIVCCEGLFHVFFLSPGCGKGDELAVLWSRLGEVEFCFFCFCFFCFYI